MKKLQTALWAAMLLSLVSTAVLLVLMPDTVPVHYDFTGQVDRFGSKYEYLIWPAVTLVMGFFFLWVLRLTGKKSTPAETKVLLWAAILTVLFFVALGMYFMVRGMSYETTGAKQPPDVIRFTGIAVGVLLILLGNQMPRARRNALFGLRTSWSMANDTVWQKSQRVGGFASVICGVVLLVLSCFVPGLWNLLVMTVCILIWLLVCLVASHRIWKAAGSPRREK